MPGGGPSPSGGGGASDPSGATSQQQAAASAAVTAAVVAAATELSAILATKETVDVATAQTVTNFMSTLIESETSVGGDNEVNEESSKQIAVSIMQLARAVTASPNAGEVRLSSPQLNLTAEARPVAELAAKPVTCDTRLAAPTEVSLPADLLARVQGVDPTLPVSVVLFASAINLHKPLQHGVGGGGRAPAASAAQRHRRAQAAAEASPNATASGSGKGAAPAG